MSNVENQESAPESTGAEELPVPTISENSVDKQTSGSDTDAIVAKIIEQLDPLISKKVQSTKDKRIAGLERKVETLSQIEQLESMGVQISDDVKTKMRLQQLEDMLSGSQSQPVSQGSGTKLTTDDVSRTIADFALDANDPEVIEALRGTYRNKDHFTAEMGKLALQQYKKPKPDASSSLAPSVPKTPGSPDLASAQAELQRLYKNPTAKGARERMAELKKILKDT